MQRSPQPTSPANFVTALLVISLGAAAIAAQCTRDDSLPGLSLTSQPLLTSATPRTVTDERPVRLVPTVDKGPEVLAPQMEGIVTAVYVKPGDALAEGKPVLSVSGIERLGLAAAAPFYRRTAQTGREFTLLCLTSGSAAGHDADAPQGGRDRRRANYISSLSAMRSHDCGKLER